MLWLLFVKSTEFLARIEAAISDGISDAWLPDELGTRHKQVDPGPFERLLARQGWTETTPHVFTKAGAEIWCRSQGPSACWLAQFKAPRQQSEAAKELAGSHRYTGQLDLF